MTGALNSLQFEVSALKAMAELLRDQPTTTEHLDALSASMVALEIESDLLRDRITNCREYQNERALLERIAEEAENLSRHVRITAA